ncbi:hypothetical protein NM688_g2153 [Phlebia brevispora]|uniref:Uncharacterized protein n=1 Tax=Phlebia brevispora TaxID=194682 RepID=A0ACC1T9N7_9APHY|nr:hypothetical protein NM688_g2153 [Phlebia brevispora]
MFHDITLPMYGLLVAWCSAVLYGMNVILTAGYMQIFFSRGLKTLTNRILFVIAFTQFGLATGHVAVCLRQAIEGLINTPDVQLATLYFANQGTPPHVAQSALYVTNNLIADGVLAWRLYVVWNRNIFLCIPFGLMIVGSAVCGYVDVGQLATLSTEQLLFGISVQRWALATWSLSIATQVSATLLIAWKVWYTHIGTVGPHKSQKSMSIMWIILESGAILSLAHIFLLAFYVHKITAGGVLVAMIGQLDALVPTSMLVRVATTDRIQNQSHSTPSSHSRSWQSVQQQQRRGVSLGSNPAGSSLNKDHELYEMRGKGFVPTIVRETSIEAEDQV